MNDKKRKSKEDDNDVTWGYEINRYNPTTQRKNKK